MALVLSMSPFCEPETEARDEASPSIYQPIWESEHCSKSCISTPSPLGGNAREPHYTRTPDHVLNRVAVSRISYFKRKFVEDEEPVLSFRSYCHTQGAPVLEERAHLLRISLEKLRYMDDPECFLRRSVLINNLLHRLRNHILLQSDWCLPSDPTATPCPLQTPAQTPATLQSRVAPAGPHRKRLRLLRRESTPCVPACCCLYLQLPLSVYERNVNSHPSSSSSSTSVRFPQLLEEEDSDDEEELDSVCPVLELCRAETRDQNRPWEGLRAQNHRTPEKERDRVRGGKVTVGVSQRWFSDTMSEAHVRENNNTTFPKIK